MTIVRLLPLLGLLLLGCSEPEVMTVIAGSELKDVAPLTELIDDATKVRLTFHYTGTLDGAEAIMQGEVYDLAWFSHGKYLTLLQERSRKVHAQEKIMLSPVVLGVKEYLARDWGWLEDGVTWSDIAERADNGELRFAMTNPTASNTGFTATLGVAAAFAGSADAITAEAVDAKELTRFFSGQKLTAGSSGWLAEAYVREQERLDGLINYESVLLGLNQSGKLKERLALIYPRDGIVTADYPLMLLNPDRREAYQRLVEFLKSPDFQQHLMAETARRPVNPQVRLDSRFPDRLLLELPFPNSLQTINALLFAYLDEYRLPSHAFFVLDVSGSMQGERLADLKRAMDNLTGEDRSVTGQFARFRSRERITLIPFSSQVVDTQHFTVNDPTANSADMRRIRDYVSHLDADGGTALYTALQQAYHLAGAAQEEAPNRYYSIVVMSDGQSNQGLSEDDFANRFGQLSLDVRQIKTFPIVFGEAEEEAMMRLATLTGGRVFDSRQHSLSSVFKKIRGYQ